MRYILTRSESVDVTKYRKVLKNFEIESYEVDDEFDIFDGETITITIINIKSIEELNNLIKSIGYDVVVYNELNRWELETICLQELDFKIPNQEIEIYDGNRS